jgi:hypothetical protein
LQSRLTKPQCVALNDTAPHCVPWHRPPGQVCAVQVSEGSLQRLRDSHCTGVQRKARSLTSSRCSFGRATKTDFAKAMRSLPHTLPSLFRGYSHILSVSCLYPSCILAISFLYYTSALYREQGRPTLKENLLTDVTHPAVIP